MVHILTRGYTADPTVDNVQLVGISPSTFDETPTPSEIITILRDGSKRKTLFLRGSGFPDLDVRYSWRASYSTIARLDESSAIRRTLEGILSDPSKHQWVVWRHITISFSGNGLLSEWLLPFSLATAIFNLPAEDPLGLRSKLYASKQLVGDNVGLTVIEKTTSEFDAETALPGEIFVDIESTPPRLKLDTVMTISDRLYVSFIPLFNVFITNDTVSNPLRAGVEARVIIVEQV